MSQTRKAKAKAKTQSRFRPTRKNPGIGPLKKGDLTQFGYVKVQTLPTETRHAALRAAVDAYGSLTVWRKLNAIAIYSRFRASEASRIFLKDRNWIRRTFGIKKEE
jgi:hypothetical protein